MPNISSIAMNQFPLACFRDLTCGSNFGGDEGLRGDGHLKQPPEIKIHRTWLLLGLRAFIRPLFLLPAGPCRYSGEFQLSSPNVAFPALSVIAVWLHLLLYCLYRYHSLHPLS